MVVYPTFHGVSVGMESTEVCRHETTYPELDVDIDVTAGAAADTLLAPSTVCVPDEVHRRRRVHVKLDGGRLHVNFLVVHVANPVDLECIATAAIWLDRKLSTRSRERLVVLLRVLCVPLRTVVHSEWRGAVKDQRSGNADVSRAVLAKTDGFAK